LQEGAMISVEFNSTDKDNVVTIWSWSSLVILSHQPNMDKGRTSIVGPPEQSRNAPGGETVGMEELKLVTNQKAEGFNRMGDSPDWYSRSWFCPGTNKSTAMAIEDEVIVNIEKKKRGHN